MDKWKSIFNEILKYFYNNFINVKNIRFMEVPLPLAILPLLSARNSSPVIRDL